jgi:hypothetical protein
VKENEVNWGSNPVQVIKLNSPVWRVTVKEDVDVVHLEGGGMPRGYYATVPPLNFS